MRRTSILALLLVGTSAVSRAQTLIANFDALAEASYGPTLTDGEITLLNLDNGVTGVSPSFSVDMALGTLSGQPGFTPNNAVGFGNLIPGSQAGFVRCKSFDVRWTGGSASAGQIEVFNFGPGTPAGNIVTLQALAAGSVVASSSFTITNPFGLAPHTLAVAAPAFDEMRILGTGPQESGTFWAVVDSIRVVLAPASGGTPECFGDGASGSCPCSNTSAIGQELGCLNSLGLGGRLRSAGVASLASDSVWLGGSQLPNGPALYYQGSIATLGGAGAPFGDGLRCAGGAVVRIGVCTSVGGSSQFPGPTDLALHTIGVVTAPGVRYYQLWYRDSAGFCTTATFNLTNGLALTWAP